MRSGNPSLNINVFRDLPAVVGSEVMTVNGTVNKTAILLFLLIVSASWTWSSIAGRPEAAMGFVIFAGIAAFIVALFTMFKKTVSPISAPIYALLQGVVLGSLSFVFDRSYPGIVLQAVSLTFGVMFCMLGAYKSGMIKMTDNLKLGVMAATGGIGLVYLASFVLGFFGVSLGVFGSGPIGILFSLVVVGVAAFNLVLDFDFIEQGARDEAPKYMEWYAAFGLMVTLIWLYMEILRLLSKLRDRR